MIKKQGDITKITHKLVKKKNFDNNIDENINKSAEKEKEKFEWEEINNLKDS